MDLNSRSLTGRARRWQLRNPAACRELYLRFQSLGLLRAKAPAESGAASRA